MTALKNVLSILAAVAAGFFLLGASMLAFVHVGDSLPRGAMAGAGAVCAGLALACYVVAALLRDFRDPLRLAGIVLLSVAAYDVLMALTFACMLHSPETMQAIAQAAPAGQPSLAAMLDKPGPGLALTVGFGVAGFVLLRLSRPAPER